MPFALGLIEATGLAAAIAALDTALKTADVTALEIESSNGSGRQTVKFIGSVSAVEAAVTAGAAAAGRVGGVYAVRVIARPSEALERYICPNPPGPEEPPAPEEAEQSQPPPAQTAVPAPEAGPGRGEPKSVKRRPGRKRTSSHDKNQEVSQ